MKSKAIVLALLAFAFGAQAAVVSSQQAAVAAGAWARLGKGAALGAHLGEKVLSSREIVVENGCSFHVVRLESGTVFLSGDTDFEPVIAFTSNPDVTLEKGTPLYDLLCGDMRARVGDRARQRQAAVSAGLSPSVGAPASVGRANSQWALLLAASPKTASAAVSSAKPVASLAQDEIYVAPMLKTQWSQQTAGGKPCYNYYTPNNWPCGCSATAMAQVMRYHAFPTEPLDAEATFEIAVGKEKKSVTFELGESGAFDWEKMVDVPERTALTEEQCEAIGKLTYNAGVALHMEYGKEGSSALPENEWPAFKAFGYQGGQVFWDGTSYSTGEGGLHTAATRHNVLLTSLDAGLPVLLSIYGYAKVGGEMIKDSAHWSGHAVVGDGYGFKTIGETSTEYMHINLGWAGSDDAWYNIPEIDCSSAGAIAGGSPYDFLYLGGAAYGISPAEVKEIVSGRVSNEDGKGLENITVTASDPVSGAEIATAQTGPQGVFFFQFDSETSYKIKAETTEGRKLIAILDDPVKVGRTVADSDTGIVKSAAFVGSRWLGDIVLKDPTVAVVDGSSGETVLETPTLEQAFEAARTVPQPTLKILFETRLRKSVSVDFACTVVATNDDPYAASIVCADGAALTVDAGGAVTLTNVVFGKTSATPVSVKAGGLVRLGGTVDFSAAEGVVALDLAEATGLTVFAPLTKGFALACEGAMNLGDAFGRTEGLDEAAATASAQLIANADFENGEVRGSAQETGGAFALVWAEVPVPVEESAGYFLNPDGTPNASARLDFLFDKFVKAAGTLPEGAARIVVRKSGALKDRYTLAHDVELVGERDAFGDWPTVTAAKDAGFVLADDCAFDVKNFRFAAHEGAPILDVQGATGTVSACEFTDILGTTGVAGALAVRAQGHVTVRDCLFDDCRTTRTQLNCYGGAITIKDEGSHLSIFDSTIQNCFANAYGGGLYAEKGASLEIGGKLVVRDNMDGTATSNIYLAHTNVTLSVAEKLTGGTGAVGVRIYKGNSAGYRFAEIGGDMDASEVLVSAQSFACDADAGLEACDFNNAGEWFAWRTHVEDRSVDKSQAVAEVRRAGEATGRYYGTLADAFADLGAADGTLTLLADCDFVDDVTLAGAVTITSEGGPFTVTRANASALFVAKEATLTLTDVVMAGGGVPVGGVQPVSRAFLCVDGGALDLQDGVTLRGLYGDGSRASGAVAVYNGGTLTLNDGAQIVDCGNVWTSAADATGYGAVSVDAGTVMLRGGEISGCTAYAYGGGLFAGNGSTVRISGAVTLTGSTDAAGGACNLTVADKSSLELDGKLTGTVGVKRAFSAPLDVFGRVTADLEFVALTNSAAHFANDETGAYGMAVTNAASDKTFLVWSTAIGEDGSVVLTQDGEAATYWCVGDIPPKTPKAVPLPIAFSALATPVEPETYVISVTAAVSKCWYSLYETNSLTGGFKTEGVQPVARKQATEDGTITFTRPKTGESLFWKVVASPEE